MPDVFIRLPQKMKNGTASERKGIHSVDHAMDDDHRRHGDFTGQISQHEIKQR